MILVEHAKFSFEATNKEIQKFLTKELIISIMDAIRISFVDWVVHALVFSIAHTTIELKMKQASPRHVETATTDRRASIGASRMLSKSGKHFWTEIVVLLPPLIITILGFLISKSF